MDSGRRADSRPTAAIHSTDYQLTAGRPELIWSLATHKGRVLNAAVGRTRSATSCLSSSHPQPTQECATLTPTWVFHCASLCSPSAMLSITGNFFIFPTAGRRATLCSGVLPPPPALLPKQVFLRATIGIGRENINHWPLESLHSVDGRDKVASGWHSVKQQPLFSPI